MNHKYWYFSLALLSLSLFNLGCTSSTSPANNPNNGGPSGTLYFSVLGNGVSTHYYKLDLGSHKATNIAFGQYPQVLADRSILGVVGSDLAIVSADGASKQVIVAQNNQEPFDVKFDDRFNDPKLSPDGKYIAYDNDDIWPTTYVVDRTTGQLLLTVADEANKVYFAHPTWAPDGSLYVEGHSTTNPGIYRIDPQTFEYSRVDPNLNQPLQPTVSPDGKKIAFILNDHVWTMNIDGTNAAQLSTSSGTESYPAWSPDSKWVVVYGTGCKFVFLPLQGTTAYTYDTFDEQSLCALSNGQMDWK